MKVVFLGAGSIAETVLKALAADFDVIAIMPQIEVPEKAIGGITAIARSKRIKLISSLDCLMSVDAETLVSCSFNRRIPKRILNKFKCINIHYGLLPRYRGWHPINWAIINDEKHVGFTIHLMDEGIDSGPILFQRRIEVLEDDTALLLTEKLNARIGMDLIHVLKDFKKIKPKKQTARPLYCCLRVPEDGLIDWNLPPRRIFNLVRALSQPYPGAFTYLNNKKIVIERVRLLADGIDYQGLPGAVIKITSKSILVATGEGALVVEKIRQRDKIVDAAPFVPSIKVRFKNR
jgi:methionyl-tRNA formyltransferase